MAGAALSDAGGRPPRSRELAELDAQIKRDERRLAEAKAERRKMVAELHGQGLTDERISEGTGIRLPNVVAMRKHALR